MSESKAVQRAPCMYRVLLKLGLVALVVLLTGCGSHASAQPGNQSAVITPASAQLLSTLPGMLTEIHMVDASTGWAIGWRLGRDGSYHIFRTSDGGSHWQDLLTCRPTVNQGKDFIEPCHADFRSTMIATVVQPEMNSSTHVRSLRIFHTADAGQHWQSSQLLAADLATPATFVDALHGWAFVTEDFPGSDPGSAYIGKEISLYRTVDGGQSWQRAAHGPAISQLPATSDDGYGQAPLTANAQMVFTSSTTGWLSGETWRNDSTSQPWLYVTHDGGTTWSQSSLTFPTNASVSAPTFFNQQEGVVQVSSGEQTAGGKLYVTRDGGKTWDSTSIQAPIGSETSLTFQDAWAPASNNSSTLYETSDGWQHWTMVRVRTSFKRIRSFDFISLKMGWALADNLARPFPAPGGGMRTGDIITLLKTTDGGVTWRTVATSQI